MTPAPALFLCLLQTHPAGSVSKHNSILQINTQHCGPSLPSSLPAHGQPTALSWGMTAGLCGDSHVAWDGAGRGSPVEPSCSSHLQFRRTQALLKVCLCHLGYKVVIFSLFWTVLLLESSAGGGKELSVMLSISSSLSPLSTQGDRAFEPLLCFLQASGQ